MEETQRREVGRRLWELRENSPETNRSIGDAVDVSERTVAEWIAGRQGITYDHAKAVASLFDVDLDWFWRGKEAATPDLIGALNNAGSNTTEAGIEKKLDTILKRLSKIEAAMKAPKPAAQPVTAEEAKRLSEGAGHAEGLVPDPQEQARKNEPKE